MSSFVKSVLAWGAIITVLVLVAYMYYESNTRGRLITYSEFLDAVEQGHVGAVTIRGDDIQGTFTDPAATPPNFTTHAPDGPSARWLLVDDQYSSSNVQLHVSTVQLNAQLVLKAVSIGGVPFS